VRTDIDRRIFDSLDSGVLWFDAGMRVVEANRVARDLLGLGDGPLCARVDELGLRQTDAEGADMALEQRPLWRALNGAPAPVTGLVVVHTPRHGARWLRVNALVLDDAAAPGAAAVVSFTDITEERAARRSLEASEQMFRLFGAHSLDVMWIADPRTQRLLYVNHAYERIWGRPSALLHESLSHWLDGVEPEDLQRVVDAAQATNADGLYEAEYRIRRPDGRLVWIRGRGFPIYGEDGRIRYMAGFAEDVTLARAAEGLRGAHRLAQERLEHIVATAPGAVHSYRRRADGRGEFTFASPAIRELLGVAAQALVDDRVDLLDLVHPDDRALLADSLRLSAERGGAWLATFRVPSTPAGERCIEAHSMPVREGDGAVVWHGFFIDITERRRVEQEIRSLNVELEQRVAERTAELEAKHREMESFTYSVSHDLKAPLRGIDGYSRLLESDHRDSLAGEGGFFIAMIRKATAQMGELIDDLLAYSRVERGRPRLGAVAPAAVVDIVTASASEEISDGGVALRIDVDPALRVLAEKEGLVLALRNLVDNALKFTAGQPERVIEIGARSEHGRGVFWVRDNGRGFDMRYHDRIFEIFQRLHRAEDYPGTGVGLAIVRKAVERMNGRVWAHSAPAEGATFYIELPAFAEADVPRRQGEGP